MTENLFSYTYPTPGGLHPWDHRESDTAERLGTHTPTPAQQRRNPAPSAGSGTRRSTPLPSPARSAAPTERGGPFTSLHRAQEPGQGLVGSGRIRCVGAMGHRQLLSRFGGKSSGGQRGHTCTAPC